VSSLIRNNKSLTIKYSRFFLLLIFLVNPLLSQTEIRNNINENTTWDIDGSPYILMVNVTVFARLDIEAGVEIIMNGAGIMTRTDRGQIISEGAIFRGGGSIRLINMHQASSVIGCVLDMVSVQCEYREHFLTRCEFHTHGILCSNGGTANVSNCVFSDLRSYPFNLYCGSVELENNAFENCEIEAIAVAGERWRHDVTLSDQGLPYHLTGDVSTERTLWIEPGCHFDMNEYNLGGRLEAEGSTFRGNNYLSLVNGSMTDCIFEGVGLFCNSGTISNCEIRDVQYGIRCGNGGRISVSNTLFRNMEDPVRLYCASVQLDENEYINCENEVIAVYGGRWLYDVTLSGQELPYQLRSSIISERVLRIQEGCDFQLNRGYISTQIGIGRILAENSSFSGGGSIWLRNANQISNLTNCNLEGVSVQCDYGVQALENCEFHLSGVSCQWGGVATVSNCVFSDLRSYPFNLYCGSVELENNAFENCEIEAIAVAGERWRHDVTLSDQGLPYHLIGDISTERTIRIEPGCHFDMYDHGLGGRIIAEGSIFSGGTYLSLGEGGSINNCLLNDCSISIGSNSQPRIGNSQISNSRNGIYSISEHPLDVTNIDFISIGEYGILNRSDNLITAQNCYWGHPTGPYHDELNPEGSGCDVSDNVVFEPWLRMPWMDMQPQVTLVDIHQESFPSKIVQIRYDYQHGLDIASLVTLQISPDRGQSWGVPIVHTWGDIGQQIFPGQNKIIYWNAGIDFPNHVNNQMKVRIIADDSPPDELAAGTERTFELIDGVEIEMCWIPPGSFMMGAQENEQDAEESEYPRHRVTINNGFWMGKYEVTQAQWEEVMGNNPAHFQGASRPVERVSWVDIQDFEMEVEYAFRLPSESEWEYACRAGHDETRFFWGDDPDYEGLSNYAWYNENSDNQTHNVGQKEPNPWGLYDMSGDVWEWCEDPMHENYNRAPINGRVWQVFEENISRVIRGGSWWFWPYGCRSSYRLFDDLNGVTSGRGFRLVRNEN
jgi:formylglycine-generating enzyme required for sulfatase activity